MLPSLVVAAASLALAPPADPPPKFDHLGDPLPPGAVCWYGTTRYRMRGKAVDVALSPSGKRLSVSNNGPTWLTVLDLGTGHTVAELATETKVRAHAFLSDTTLAVATETQLLLWEPAGKTTLLDPEHLPGGTHALAVAPDGKRWAVSGEDGVRILSFPVGELVAASATDGQVRQIAFSPDGQRLLGVLNSDAARLWDAATGKRIRTWYPKGSVHRILFSADGKRFFVQGNEELEAFRLDDDAPDPGFTPPSFQKIPVHDLRRVAGGTRLRVLTDTADRHVIELDAVTGAEQTAYKRPDAALETDWAVLGVDGRTVVAGQGDAVNVWDAETGAVANPTQFGSMEWSAVAADGKTVRTLDGDGTVHEWDSTTGRPVAIPRTFSDATHWNAGLTRFLTRTGPDVTVHDARTGAEGRKLALELGEKEHAWFYQGERDLVFVARNSQTTFYDTTTGRQAFRIPIVLGAATTEAVAPDGRTLWTVSDGGIAHLWELGTRQMRTQAPVSAHRLYPDPDGKHVWFSVRGKAELVRCDWATGKPVRTVALPESLAWLNVSPDGKRVAAFESGGPTVWVYDAATGAQTHEVSAPRHTVNHVEFSPDGTRMFTNGAEGVVYVWDVTRPIRKPGREAKPPAFRHGADAVRGLRNADAELAHLALVWLRDHPAEAVKALAAAFPPVPPVSDARFEQLLRSLGDSEYKTRRAAEVELEKLGPAAEQVLRVELENPRSEQVRETAERLLARVADTELSGDRLAAVRAAEAAERIGTPEAAKVLEAWAGGAAGATLTTEAKAALERVKKGK
jgi:WD40 repeat protein